MHDTTGLTPTNKGASSRSSCSAAVVFHPFNPPSRPPSLPASLPAPPFAQDAVFWIAVIMLFVLVQNILLAIVAVAYDEANLLEGGADASFVFVAIIRLTWYPVYAYYRLWRRMR